MLTLFFFGFIGSIFFWPVFFILAFILCAMTEKEEATWSVLLTAVIISLASFKIPVINSAFDSWGKAAITIGGYLVMGVIWSCIKWALRARSIRTKFISIRDNYIAKHDLESNYFSKSLYCESRAKHHANFAEKIEQDMRKELNSTYNSLKTAQGALSCIIPKIGDHKKSVTMWAAYWPVSLTWFAINDAMKEIAETIYNFVSGTFQKMSDYMFKDVI